MHHYDKRLKHRASRPKYCDMLLNDATKELGDLELLVPAVALNRGIAPASLQEDGAVMGGTGAKASVEALINKNLRPCSLAPGDGPVPEGRWTNGPSIDGKGACAVFRNQPFGAAPVLGAAHPDSGAEARQIG